MDENALRQLHDSLVMLCELVESAGTETDYGALDVDEVNEASRPFQAPSYPTTVGGSGVPPGHIIRSDGRIVKVSVPDAGNPSGMGTPSGHIVRADGRVVRVSVPEDDSHYADPAGHPERSFQTFPGHRAQSNPNLPRHMVTGRPGFDTGASNAGIVGQPQRPMQHWTWADMQAAWNPQTQNSMYSFYDDEGYVPPSQRLMPVPPDRQKHIDDEVRRRVQAAERTYAPPRPTPRQPQSGYEPQSGLFQLPYANYFAPALAGIAARGLAAEGAGALETAALGHGIQKLGDRLGFSNYAGMRTDNPNTAWVTPDESFWHGRGAGSDYDDQSMYAVFPGWTDEDERNLRRERETEQRQTTESAWQSHEHEADPFRPTRSIHPSSRVSKADRDEYSNYAWGSEDQFTGPDTPRRRSPERIQVSADHPYHGGRRGIVVGETDDDYHVEWGGDDEWTPPTRIPRKHAQPYPYDHMGDDGIPANVPHTADDDMLMGCEAMLDALAALQGNIADYCGTCYHSGEPSILDEPGANGGRRDNGYYPDHRSVGNSDTNYPRY